jgi:Domain of unknown function (DUF5103)
VGRKNDSFRKLSVWVFLMFVFFSHCDSWAQIALDEKCTEEQIKSIMLFSVLENDAFENKYRNSPIVNLNAIQALLIEFDDLSASYRQFKVKIIHTDENWIPSKLRDLQYLRDFNEYFINDYKVSQGPKIPYYHYSFQVPKPKIGGNFVIKIYEGFDENNVIIQKRFSVLDSKIGVQCKVLLPNSGSKWKSQQQLNIELLFGSYFINFPQKELIVKVIQNQNPNTTKTLSNSNLYKSGPNTFSFKNFEDSLLFNGLNEFRFIDFADPYRRGQNIHDIIISEPNQVFSTLQKNRGKFNYAQSYDSDGCYIPSTPDRNNPDLTADYFRVHIASENKNSTSPPKIFGKFTDWKPIEMELNLNQGHFESSFLLKQGVYDFMIDSGENFEGNFSETNNTYEVLVYQKTPAKAYIELIGYTKVQMGR